MALILGIDRFMSECRSLTNFIGNAVATIVVARWDNALDRDQLAAALSGAPADGADGLAGGATGSLPSAGMPPVGGDAAIAAGSRTSCVLLQADTAETASNDRARNGNRLIALELLDTPLRTG